MKFLDEILETLTDAETKSIDLGKDRDGNPINVEFRIIKDASEIEALGDQVQAFVIERCELHQKNTKLSGIPVEVFPSDKRILAKAFVLSHLCQDKDLDVVWWLTLAKKGGPVFNSIADRVDGLVRAKSGMEVYIDAEKKP